ncbi:THAP domain-containing protein 9, partial [Camponotus floridanus]
IRVIDRLFDTMNTRNGFGTGFKSPMTINNLKLVKQFFDDSITYISGLKMNDINIFVHSRSTFALGFVINCQSFYNLAHDLLYKKVNALRYFLAYKCSQDHLELFFSCIRGRGGWNDNPNVLQFKWALRQLLFRNSVRASFNANCLGDTYEVPAILKFRTPKRTIHDDNCININEEELQALSNSIDNVNLSFLQQNILYYITGSIIRTLLTEIHCHHCINILIERN